MPLRMPARGVGSGSERSAFSLRWLQQDYARTSTHSARRSQHAVTLASGNGLWLYLIRSVSGLLPLLRQLQFDGTSVYGRDEHVCTVRDLLAPFASLTVVGLMGQDQGDSITAVLNQLRVAEIV